jgi:hypothetical protein
MKLTKHVVIKSNSRTDFTDADKAAAYALEVGGTVEIVEEEIIEPEPVIEDYEVALWRIKSVLKLMGMDAQINAAIQGMPEPNRTVASIAWEYAYTIARRSATVAFVQQVLSLSDEQVDGIFEQARGLEI